MIDFPYSSASEWIVSCRCVVFICMYVNECLDITWRGLYVWLNTSVGGFLVIVAYVQVSFRLWCYRPNMWNLENLCETKWQIVWMLQAGSFLFKCRRVWVWNWMYGGDLFQRICLPVLTCHRVTPLGGRKIQTRGTGKNFGGKQQKDCWSTS